MSFRKIGFQADYHGIPDRNICHRPGELREFGVRVLRKSRSIDGELRQGLQEGIRERITQSVFIRGPFWSNAFAPAASQWHGSSVVGGRPINHEKFGKESFGHFGHVRLVISIKISPKSCKVDCNGECQDDHHLAYAPVDRFDGRIDLTSQYRLSHQFGDRIRLGA
nr:hypothetical protein [Rhizobium leguminosarum]